MNKLVEPWWEELRNPITGFKAGSQYIKGSQKPSDEVKYFNAYPKLDL